MFEKEKNSFGNSNYCDSSNCPYREDLKNEFSFLITTFNQVLRDPICAAYSTLQLMESQTPEVTNSKYWRCVMNDMKDLIQRLDQCDAYAHAKKTDLQRVDLLPLLQEGVESIHATKESSNIEFDILCDKNSEQAISNYICDPTKIKIAFMNIIQFLSHTMENTKTVTIHIDANPKNLCMNIDGNTYFILTFSGDGRPLSNNIIASLFEPFPTNKKKSKWS